MQISTKSWSELRQRLDMKLLTLVKDLKAMDTKSHMTTRQPFSKYVAYFTFESLSTASETKHIT